MPLAALLAASGCKVGPNYTPPTTAMPARYGELTTSSSTLPAQADPPAVDEIRWWRRFDDPELAKLVEGAVKANQSVAVAQARLREARAARQIIQSFLYPEVSVGASAFRYHGGQAISPILPGNIDGNLFQLGFDAAWAVDLWGGTRRAVESARAGEQAVNANRRAVVLMVAAETARAYLELRGAQRELAVARTTLEEQQQTLEVTEDKHRNGLASDLEVVRARTEVESTAAEIPPLEEAIRQYIHVISTLLALEPTALSRELENPAPIPSGPRQVAVGIPSELLRRRPDIQAAERELAASTAAVGVATAQLFPQMVLGGTAGVASRGVDDLFNINTAQDSSGCYAAGPFINWTIFDAGRRGAGIKLTKAQVDAAKASYEDTVLQAFREVESGLVAVRCEQAQLDDLKRLCVSAREAATIARRDYQRGILDQLTVLDAERQSSRADMLEAQAQVSLVVDVVSLYKAIGGGWEIAEPPVSKQSAGAIHNKGDM